MIKVLNNPFKHKRRKVQFTVDKRVDNVTVVLKDAATNLRIYSFKAKYLDPSAIYYLEPSTFAQKWVDNFYLEIVNVWGGREGFHVFLSNPDFRPGITIQDKFITFPDTPSDDFNTYCEVFKAQYYLSDIVKPSVGGVVLDIGANIGLASLWFQQFNPSRVVAVEPESETMEHCKLTLQKFDNVEYVQKAVARETGTVEFEVTDNSACNQIKGRLPLSSDKVSVVEVEAININDLIKEHNLDVIDYLKVDCEGGEVDLFDTIDPEYLQNKVKKVVVEYHSQEIREFLKEKLKGFMLEKDISLEYEASMGLLYYYNPKFIK